MNLSIETAREITSFYLLTARKVSKTPEKFTCKWFGIQYKDLIICQKVAWADGLNNISINGSEVL